MKVPNTGKRKESEMLTTAPLERHYAPKDFRDRIAYAFVVLMRLFTDAFFACRYGHRAEVLETVAAVPGVVNASLRRTPTTTRH